MDLTQRCRHCGHSLQANLIDLGKSPLCQTFLTSEQLDEMEHPRAGAFPFDIQVHVASLFLQKAPMHRRAQWELTGIRKHEAESWGGRRFGYATGGYVSNAALIVAALLLDLQLRRPRRARKAPNLMVRVGGQR